MKKAIKLTLAVVLVMGSTSLFAQKFGRINTQEIIMAMPETKTMQENMDTFAKELSDNIETMNVEFNTKLQDFQKNFNTYSDAIKEMKQKELEDMQNRTREFQERAQQDYQKKQNELLAPIIDKAKGAIDKVSGHHRRSRSSTCRQIIKPSRGIFPQSDKNADSNESAFLFRGVPGRNGGCTVQKVA